MSRCSGRGKPSCVRLLAAMMVVVGLAIVLFSVPYWFWAAMLGLVLTLLGILLWTA